jgi:hypothetical protein
LVLLPDYSILKVVDFLGSRIGLFLYLPQEETSGKINALGNGPLSRHGVNIENVS